MAFTGYAGAMEDERRRRMMLGLPDLGEYTPSVQPEFSEEQAQAAQAPQQAPQEPAYMPGVPTQVDPYALPQRGMIPPLPEQETEAALLERLNAERPDAGWFSRYGAGPGGVPVTGRERIAHGLMGFGMGLQGRSGEWMGQYENMLKNRMKLVNQPYENRMLEWAANARLADRGRGAYGSTDYQTYQMLQASGQIPRSMSFLDYTKEFAGAKARETNSDFVTKARAMFIAGGGDPNAPDAEVYKALGPDKLKQIQFAPHYGDVGGVPFVTAPGGGTSFTLTPEQAMALQQQQRQVQSYGGAAGEGMGKQDVGYINTAEMAPQSLAALDSQIGLAENLRQQVVDGKLKTGPVSGFLLEKFGIGDVSTGEARQASINNAVAFLQQAKLQPVSENELRLAMSTLIDLHAGQEVNEGNLNKLISVLKGIKAREQRNAKHAYKRLEGIDPDRAEMLLQEFPDLYGEAPQAPPPPPGYQ